MAGKIYPDIILKAAFLACLFLFCVSCGSRRAAPQTPRPQSGYLRMLEKDSMLTQAPAIIAQVSQSERVWLNGGQRQRAKILLDAAPVWVRFQSGAAHHFARLRAELAILPHWGIKGLWLGQIGENMDIWLEQTRRNLMPRRGSFSPDEALGGAEEYADLLREAEGMGIETGAEIVPAATGRGPDFILQARNAAGHKGLYAMLPAAPDKWDKLPGADSEWEISALPRQKVDELAASGMLPGKLARDDFVWTNPGGWAATGPVMGVDGVPRRWLYRYNKDPAEPVLLWQDPSGAAKRVFSASIIQITGLNGQTLAGLSLESIMGLEPAGEEGNSDNLAPGLAAVNELSAEIHRYGGWAIQIDPLPPSAMRAILAGPCDFCADAPGSILLNMAFQFGEVEALASLYKTRLSEKLDLSRLAQGLNDNCDPLILKSLPDGEALYKKFVSSGNKSSIAENFWSDQGVSWRLGMPGLVFLDAGIFSEEKYGSGKHVESRNDENLRSLLAWREKAGLALAQFAKLEKTASCLGLLHTLPNGDYWLVAANFSKKEKFFKIRLPARVKDALDCASNENLAANLPASGLEFSLALDGQQVRNVLFHKD